MNDGGVEEFIRDNRRFRWFVIWGEVKFWGLIAWLLLMAAVLGVEIAFLLRIIRESL